MWENSQGKSETKNWINIPSTCKRIARNNIMTVTVKKQCILTAHRNILQYLTSHQNALVLVKAYTARHKCACCIYDCVALPKTFLPLESAEQFPSWNTCSNISLIYVWLQKLSEHRNRISALIALHHSIKSFGTYFLMRQSQEICKWWERSTTILPPLCAQKSFAISSKKKKKI